ncbi:MAG: precorrin-6A reductase [Eubacteriaceae bacterium]|nr:precorrin-6A reductase [Eubacteriaceae bacterium]
MANNIAVFSGTSDGRLIAKMISELIRKEKADSKLSVTEYVATDYGRDLADSDAGVTVKSGRLDASAMKEEFKDAFLVIDATHPYAVEVTKNIREACEEAGVRYLRLMRDETLCEEGVVMVSDTEACAEYLKSREGNVLLTTGSKELMKYKDSGVERLYARVLPLESSITSARDAGIPVKNIIGMQGPFTDDFNQALIRFYHIDIMVTKDSGTEGGFDDKLRAARECGVECVVIRRPEDAGYSLEKVYEMTEEMIKCM